MASGWLGLARRRRAFRWTAASSTGACSTPRAASACRCRSASDNSSRSTSTASPARSRDSTCCGAARPASSTPTWATSNGSSPSSGCPTCSCSIPSAENDYLGFDNDRPGAASVAGHHPRGHPGGDRACAPRRRGRRAASNSCGGEWERFADGARSLDEFHAELPGFVERLAALPRTRDPLDLPARRRGRRLLHALQSVLHGGRARPLRRTRHHPQAGRSERPVSLRRLSSRGGNRQRLGDEAGRPGPGQGLHEDLSAGGEGVPAALARLPGASSVPRNTTASSFGRPVCWWPDANDVASVFEKAAEHVSPKIFGEIIPDGGRGPGSRAARATTALSSSGRSTASRSGSPRPSSSRSASSRGCPS